MVTKNLFIIASEIGLLDDVNEENFTEIAQELYVWYEIKINDYSCLFQGPMSQHIEAETNWTPFRRQHFQMHFLEWKYMNFAPDFTEISS